METKISAKKKPGGVEIRVRTVDAVCEGVAWRQGSEDDCEHQNRRVTFPTHSLMTSVGKSEKLAKMVVFGSPIDEMGVGDDNNPS